MPTAKYPQLMRVIVAVCAAVVLSALTGSDARAQFCASNAECGSAFFCKKWLFNAAGTCESAFCNTQADCAVTRGPTICSLGMCQATCVRDADCSADAFCNRAPGRRLGICIARPTPASGTAPGTGTPRAGEGQACGPQTFGGGVVKNVGCAQGLRCQNRRCVRPPS